MSLVTVTTATYQNPHAKLPFPLRFLVVSNTSDEDREHNIRTNSALEIPWIKAEEPHNGVAVLVGGGPSVADHLDQIRELQGLGGTVFACNAASQFIRTHGVVPSYQVIADAQPQTTALVDKKADKFLLASQVNPATLDVAMAHGQVSLWHLNIDELEILLPSRRVRRGGYAIVLGTATVGDLCLRLAYVMGYRIFHIFGFDSSHRNGESHAYKQPMNNSIPNTTVEWGNKSYYTSVAMKAQAEHFQVTARILKDDGCNLSVYGDGLLQDMYHTDSSTMSEKQVYKLMWQYDNYRHSSPGERVVDQFVEVVQPLDGAQIIDFGCGTGRASLALRAKGYNPLLVDFADNCRDQEAILMPFLEWDISQRIPLKAMYGFCADVMEHIPPGQVDNVLGNILECCEIGAFFKIATCDDVHGHLFAGRPLHLSIHPLSWWAERLEPHGRIIWTDETADSALFYVTKEAA